MSMSRLHFSASSMRNWRISGLANWAADIIRLSSFFLDKLKSLGPCMCMIIVYTVQCELSLVHNMNAADTRIESKSIPTYTGTFYPLHSMYCIVL